MDGVWLRDDAAASTVSKADGGLSIDWSYPKAFGPHIQPTAQQASPNSVQSQSSQLAAKVPA
jgi:hypothetical protein